MSGQKIVLAGLASRPKGKGKPVKGSPAEEPQEAPPAWLHLDVLERVFEKLDVLDLVNASGTSREWRAAASAADCAWRRAFVDEFGELKAADFAPLRTWRDKYIACLLSDAVHNLRRKARYLDELEDSAGALEKNAQSVLARLNQMDRTLNGRRNDLNAVLASVAGKATTNSDTKLGKELLASAEQGGDLSRFPRLTPDVCTALADMSRDLEFWRTSIATERESLHRMWDSLAYISTCCKNARTDIAGLQRRRATLEQATRWRPNVRRT